MDRVPFMAEFLFMPGGVAETKDVAFPAHGGDTVFLKQDSLTYRVGSEYICISGGNNAHRNTCNSEGENGMFRVVVSDFTQVNRTFEITFGNFFTDTPTKG